MTRDGLCKSYSSIKTWYKSLSKEEEKDKMTGRLNMVVFTAATFVFRAERLKRHVKQGALKGGGIIPRGFLSS